MEYNNKYISKEEDSPGGRHTYWFPVVGDDIEPKEADKFDTLEEGEEKYIKYADIGGFNVRKESLKKNKENGNVSYRIMVCTKAGKPQEYDYNTLTVDEGRKKRKLTTQKRCCPALAHFRFDPDTSKYELYKFEKRHNHKLFTVSDVYLSKNKRKLDYTDEKFIYDLSKCNIGATKAHSIMSTLKGGHDQVRGTKVDYKNYARDLNLCIGENDATMTVNRMNNRKENVHNFSFEYICSDSELAGLFWADETAKANFKEFGDMVSFDATYSTNTLVQNKLCLSSIKSFI